MSRQSVRISTGQTIRLEDPEHYRVHDGRIVVSDVAGTTAYGQDDEFDVPPKGGASVYCVEQAIVYAVEKPKKSKKKASK